MKANPDAPHVPVPDGDGPAGREKIGWARKVEITSHVSQVFAAIAAAVAVFVAVTSVNVQKLQQDAADATRNRDLAVQDAAIQKLLARQIRSENEAAQARLRDTAERAELTSTQLELANVELRTRTQDVVDARAELVRVNLRVASTEAERRAASDNLARAQLSAFVTAHLNRLRDLAIRERDSFTMLADPSDSDLSEGGYQFRIFLSRAENPNPDYCALSSLHAMRVIDGDSKAPVTAAMCAFLRSSLDFRTLDQLFDEPSAGKTRPTQRWEEIGDIPYTIMISREADFEGPRIESFWNDMDAGGILMVPGVRKMFDPSAMPQNQGETRAMIDRLSQFERGWTPFVANLKTPTYLQEWEASESPGAPPLVPMPRVSLRSLRSGQGETTRSFERNLLCDAAWYAAQSGLIEDYSRKMYCYR